MEADVYVEMLPVSREEFERCAPWNSLAREADKHGLRIET